MNANERALRALDRIQAATGLSNEGRISLIQMINPFADFAEANVGSCDANESSSVIQRVKFSQVIAAPASVASGANWDCNVFTLPVTNVVDWMIRGMSVGGITVTTDGSTSQRSIGGVTVTAGPAGAQLDPWTAATVTSTVECNATQLAPTQDQISRGVDGFASGISRVVAMGFEVHNTTAEISQQGSVAVYRQPQNGLFDRNTQCFLGAQGTLTAPTSYIDRGTVSVLPIYSPPGTLKAAMLLAGTQQWKAEDGCMVVPTVSTQTIDVMRLETLVPQIKTGVYEDVTLTGAGGPISMERVVGPSYLANARSPITITTPPGLKNLYPSVKYNPFNTSGAFFAGLSYPTTLVVNSIFYIERFPSSFDQALVTLANPSPAYDPLVMQLYTSIMRQLPVGVKVGDNSDGDWFYEAVSGIANFLQPALKAVPGFGPALSMGADAIGKLAQNQVQKNKKKPSQPPARKQPAATWAEPTQRKQKPGKGWEEQSGMAKGKGPKPRNKKVGKR